MAGGAAGGIGLGTLTDFVLKAVQLGALGFGAALFVMVFIILIRNQAPADAHTARLRSRFLTLGVGAFVFAGLMQLVGVFYGPKPAGRYSLSVVFAPDPETNGLPEPAMRVLPANLPVKRNEPIVIDRDATLSVGVDAIVNKTKNLTQTAQALTTANQALSEQTARLSAADGPAAVPPVELKRLETLNSRVRLDIQRGDFASAARNSVVLRDATASVAKE